jgi:Amt family ammonium transporter
LAGILCALAVDLKFSFGFDDSLDVVGIHLVGGLTGTLFLGFFATGKGLLDTGSWDQFIAQAIGAFSVLFYSFILSLIIGFAIDKTIGFRVKAEDEIAGIDTVVHGEEAYAFGSDRG